MKRESFGSGQVRSGERRSLPDSTQASLFFRFAQTIAPFTVHFVLLAELLEQAVLLLEKVVKEKAPMQSTRNYNIYFFESVVEPLITKEESRDKMNAITCGTHNKLI